MKQYTTQAIVLKRLDYQEADRIVTFLTPEHGKVTTLARGVRRVKSKLAGGIELFTRNDVVIIEGRGEIQTLRSARMLQHFPNISKQYDRLQLGYQCLQAIDKVTEEVTEQGYFQLMAEVLGVLDDNLVPLSLIQLWFQLRLLVLLGRQPDLANDITGHPLDPEQTYRFSVADSGLVIQPRGLIGVDHIKLARLCLKLTPKQLTQIADGPELAQDWLKQIPVLASY